MSIDVLQRLREASASANIVDMTSMEMARFLDSVDPLRHLRDEFHYPKMRTLPGGERIF